MIKMRIMRVDQNNDNTPILYNQEIDEYAHAVLKDYKPELLHEPGTVPFEHFLESYLGLKTIYKDIYNENQNNPILGRTIFHDGIIKVFDRENECVSNFIVRANTVIIDNYVTEAGREGMAMFTGLHEGAHFLIHSDVFSVKRRGQICCRREHMENLGGMPKTAEQWREHQANRLASSFAMPDATFVPFVNHLMREYNVWKRSIVLGYDDDLDILARDLIPERIAEVYGVSKHAALIKLKKSGFVTTV